MRGLALAMTYLAVVVQVVIWAFIIGLPLRWVYKTYRMEITQMAITRQTEEQVLDLAKRLSEDGGVTTLPLDKHGNPCPQSSYVLSVSGDYLRCFPVSQRSGRRK